MKRIFLILNILSLVAATTCSAQPAWAKKAAQAVFTLKTFGADGQLVGSSNGFFVGEDGEAVSSFAPFKGAQRAVVIDAQGKELAVEYLTGANELYDVAKFKVDSKKTTALKTAPAEVANGTALWLLPYAVKKVPAVVEGKVSSAERFQQDFSYYTLDMNSMEQQSGCPIVNANGEAVGILQPSADGKQGVSYAVSARYANTLRISGLALNDPALKATAIAKALPDNLDEAIVSLFVSSSTMTEAAHTDYIERFIQKFPEAIDGYIYRARIRAAHGELQAADDDMERAVKVATNKDDAYYQYAQLVYQKALYGQAVNGWTLDRALELSRKASAINALPVYRQQQAQILYGQEKYQEAYDLFSALSQTPLRSADNYYAAAQCQQMLGDKKAALALLDSAVAQFTLPYVKTAAPYLSARAQLEMELRRYQQAINDMKSVVELEPTNALYLAEKANMEVRVGLLDDGIQTAEECIRQAPEMSDGYLLLGLAQCKKDRKAEGLKNLQKAKELGNSQAQSFIDKYSK